MTAARDAEGGRVRRILVDLYQAALAAVDPLRVVPGGLPPKPPGRVCVVGAGKASAAMARAAEESWDGPLTGLVLTRYGHALACRQIEVVEAGHPVPDAEGQAAAARILEMAHGLGEGDLLLALISGGGSALLAAPAAGIDLDDKRDISRRLLAAGADIAEINAVRKHLSAVKGGRLALAAWPARVHALLISDVPGDDPATIASGPTVADSTTLADARKVLQRHGIAPSQRLAAALANPALETPEPGDPRLSRSTFRLLASARDALDAACRHGAALGYEVRNLGDAIEGTAGSVAERMMAEVREARQVGGRHLLVSGGECTVRVTGGGRGGPNAEFALAFAIQAAGLPGVFAISADTDGIDGAGEHAGAIVTPDTLDRAAAAGIRPRARLADNDAAGFFGSLGDLVATGPTRTNVSDFRAIIVEERG